MHLLEEQIAYPSEINNYLLLSGVAALDDPEMLEELGVTAVISVMPNPPVLHSNFRQLVVPIQDSTEVDITQFFPDVFSAINIAKSTNSKLLIHCEKGMSRSASFVIAWLLQEAHSSQNMVDYPTTLVHLKKMRAVVAPNRGFENQLKAFERSLNRNFLVNRKLQLPNLNRDSHEYYTSFLHARDKVVLSQVSVFFKRMCHQDKFWRKELMQYAGMTDAVCQLLEEHEQSFKKVYLHCRTLKSKWPISLCPSFVIGSLGIVSLTRSYLKFNNDPHNFSMVIMGASLNDQRPLIEDLSKDHDVLKVDLHTHSNLLTYAASTNNVGLLSSMERLTPNWMIKNRQGDNLLFIAALQNGIDAFKFLLAKGVDPTETNKADDNILLRVSQSNNLDIAQYIKDHLPNISPFHRNHSKLSAYDLAVKNQSTELLAIYDAWPAIHDELQNTSAFAF